MGGSSLPAQSSLIGRDRELRTLRQQLDDAIAGRGSLVLISGGAGIGKTTLADSFGREAAMSGTRLLRGQCYDRTETPPYGPWFEGFARFDGVRGSRGEHTPPRPAAAASQEAFFEQVRAFFSALAEEQPTVLILEDLHWADTASLDLLRSLARTLPALPLLLLATYRADELDRQHPLHMRIPLLVREAAAVRLDLRPLDLAATRALVDARYTLPDEAAASLADFLLARTGGNALFIMELLRTLEEERLLRRERERWQIGTLAQAPVPPLLRQVIDARLTRFGDEAIALLAVAAVIGQEVPLALWRTVTQADEEALIALAERAEAANLLVAWADGTGARFAHALIRDALYESVLPFRRRRLHGRVAEALTAQPAPDPNTVAHHFQRAGDPRAVEWLTRAGEAAEDGYALVAASERYEAAFTLLDARQGDAGERGWLRLLAAAPRIYEQPERAFRWVEEAVTLATEAADTSRTARARALRGLLLRYRGQFVAGMAELVAATDAADRLLPGVGVLRRREAQIDRMANRGTLTSSLAYVGQLAAARALGERHLARLAGASTAAEIGALADLHAGLSLLYVLQGEPALACRSYVAGIAAYAAIDHHLLTFAKQREELVMRVLRYAADDLAERERLVGAVEREAQHLLAIGACRDPTLTDQIRVPILFLEGRWREARRIAELPDAFDFSIDAQLRVLCLAQLARAQGDAALAWRCVREVWPDGPATEPGEMFVHYTVPLQLLAAALALDEGDLPAARDWLNMQGRWLAWMDATLGQAEGQLLESDWHRAAGDANRARDHAERALAHAGEPRQPLALLATHRTLGALDTDAGRIAEAAAHFAAALALADACRAPYERALTLLARCELAIALGDIAVAAADLAAVRAICTPLDARPTLARANALAARLAALTGTPPPLPGGLSAREIEVLRLVAGGLTNAQIAERLFVSPRTVNGHLTAIYAKLGVEGRAAAIRVALDHDLR